MTRHQGSYIAQLRAKPGTTQDPRIYKIVRFHFNQPGSRTLRQRLTLEQVQAHCRREDTKGDGWFDGYTKMKGHEDCE